MKRNFRKLVDRGSPATRVGRPGLRAAEAIFDAWKRHQEGRWTLPGLHRRLAAHKRKLERALRRGLKNQDRKARAMAEDLRPQFACLWTFTRTDGMAPHNNLAERMIRPAVLWRKSSFGAQSGRRSRFAECMLTVSQTLRLQGRSVLDFVELSIRVARRADAAPSLLHP